MMVQDPFYIDFSTQPDNEIWYMTFDNSPIKNINNFTETIFFVGNWGRQPDLQFVRHSYENGIGKSFIIVLLLNQVNKHLEQIAP